MAMVCEILRECCGVAGATAGVVVARGAGSETRDSSASRAWPVALPGLHCPASYERQSPHMTSPRARLAHFLLALACSATLFAPAQLSAQVSAQSADFKPEVGQSGKDVIWVPTPDSLVARMLRMARVTANDFLIDLGSGDGKIAIAAARDFRARARGIEFNPEMVALSRRNAEAAGVADRVEFVGGDLFQANLDDASVISMYLLPSINMKLRPKLLALRPGTRIVSHAFDMGDWKADETGMADGGLAHFWIVPAQLEGTWRVEHESSFGKDVFEIVPKQAFQFFEGIARRRERISPLAGQLQGDRIRFTVPDRDGKERLYVGRVVDDRIEGRTRTQGGTDIPFTAVKQ
jgi:hypothetical protein